MTPAEVEEYRREGFLFVDRPLLPVADVLEARRLIDKLFEDWDRLPRKLAPDANRDAPPVLEIKHAVALDSGLRRARLVEVCRKLSCQILGTKRTWFHFDHVIYKHAGGQAVPWHQDLAASRLRLFEGAVHFWVPLQDMTPESGGMMFVPGSHIGEIRQHEVQERLGGVSLKVAGPVTESNYVTKTLPLGGFSIHNTHIMHSSAINEGTELRKAWILQFGAGLPSAAREFSRRGLPVGLSRRIES